MRVRPCPEFECNARFVPLAMYDVLVCMGPAGHIWYGIDMVRGRPVRPRTSLREQGMVR